MLTPPPNLVVERIVVPSSSFSGIYQAGVGQATLAVQAIRTFFRVGAGKRRVKPPLCATIAT